MAAIREAGAAGSRRRPPAARSAVDEGGGGAALPADPIRLDGRTAGVAATSARSGRRAAPDLPRERAVPRAAPAAAAAGLPTTGLPSDLATCTCTRAAAVRALAVLLAATGLALALHGLWIPAKAAAAQVLLAAAWERAAAGAEQPRPWPWADTWPVARLTLPGRRPLVVLAGAQGRTLAFGPGHVDGTARPGEAGNVVLAAHRDTHFRPLATLVPGDELTLEAPGGAMRRYRVVETAVVDHRDTRPLLPSEGARLTLVTCWPFDAVRPGGPLRWVVVADAVTSRAAAGSRRPGRGGP